MAGGSYNQAGDDAGTTDDASCTTVGGGINNRATALYATIAGGQSSVASSRHATGAGGYENTAAGDSSFAAGYRAKANHLGSFVLADSTDADFGSVRENALGVRFNGGATFVVNDDYWVRFWRTGSHLIDASNGAYLTNGGVWTNASDRNAKENFAPVEGQEVLPRLAEVPIQSWSYKAEDPSVRRMGLTAQDFCAAFGLGEDERHIASLDANGVTLAAIQGLHEIVREKDDRISRLEQRNNELEYRLEALEALVVKLANGPEKRKNAE